MEDCADLRTKIAELESLTKLQRKAQQTAAALDRKIDSVRSSLHFWLIVIQHYDEVIYFSKYADAQGFVALLKKNKIIASIERTDEWVDFEFIDVLHGAEGLKYVSERLATLKPTKKRTNPDLYGEKN